MKTTPSRKRKKSGTAYHVAACGRESVSVYERTAPNGSRCYMVADYSTGKRRFVSYPTAALAIERANKLARQTSERQVIAAAMSNEQASEYAASVQKIKSFNVSLLSVADAVANCLPLVGGLADMQAACRFYRARHKQTTAKRVAEVVTELLAVKEARGASGRYLQDLRSRLTRFAESFQKNIGDVTTADTQAWLDAQKKLAPQTHVNFRRVLNLLFKFAKARGYCVDNAADGVERVKVGGREVAVFTPKELAKLLKAATPDFKPVLVLQAFAGLRSAECERLSWEDVRLAERHVVIGASRAKTASRRIVPLSDNAVAWLADYSRKRGMVWTGSHEDFYRAQQDTAKAAGVKWKANALRHSAASYMFALSNDAGRVAGFLGNSASVIHKHYRELVRPDVAKDWFGLLPEQPENVVSLPAAATR